MIDITIQKEQVPIVDSLPLSTVSYILSCLCKGQIQQKAEQKLQIMWTALKITIGHLIVRGYRTFKYFLKEEIIIFWKREAYQTQYLFMKISQRANQQLSSEYFKEINQCVKEIQKFKKKALNKFTVLMLFALDYSFLEISANPQIRQKLITGKFTTKDQLILDLPKQSLKQECFIPQAGNNESILISDDNNEHKKLKQILHSYIDTFGLKNRANNYKQVSKKIDYLINTLNLLIFQETKPTSKPGTITPLYNQIESANWSWFKMGRLVSDRKDIVLTGEGKVLFIDLTFAYKLQEYIDLTYQEQAKQLLCESSKAYGESKIKVVKIENSLTPRHVYTYFIRTIH